ncbi:MAG: hypothetical protein CSYNP_01804 [Syntrophus sp. SKADARSKE-3]|nr:hypothetical protein [Syntrophus sp. SKADARSKE-3]
MPKTELRRLSKRESRCGKIGEGGKISCFRTTIKKAAPVFMETAFIRLLKNVHLLRCAARLAIRRTSVYASFLVFCAPCI